MAMPKLPEGGLSPETQNTASSGINVDATIRAMRDSVWVINEELAREFFRNQSLRLLEANVGHLELKMADPTISGSGQDLSDITSAISAGNEAIQLIKSTLPQ